MPRLTFIVRVFPLRAKPPGLLDVVDALAINLLGKLRVRGPWAHGLRSQPKPLELIVFRDSAAQRLSLQPWDCGSTAAVPLYRLAKLHG